MTQRPLRIALPKGRMMDETLAVFERMGHGIAPGDSESRRLVLPSRDGCFEFLPVKSADLPVYVESGVADAGVAGFDVLSEHEADVLHPLDLRFGACVLAVAAPEGTPFPGLPGGATPRVATKYTGVSRRYFAARGLHVDLIRITGSVEVAPLVGLSHWIVDLVQTGRTLAENGLVVVDTILESSARWIVNRASHKLRLREHERLIAELEEALS